MKNKIICGDALTVLKTLDEKSIQTCVTSPPFFQLRDYGHEEQIGLEKTPSEYVEKLVAVFREVRRVLRDDGTLWLNLDTSYAANRSYQVTDNKHINVGNSNGMSVPIGLKPKDLIGIPWLVAFALQSDGWWLRQDIIIHKKNAMPESCLDRCTKAHEYLFLLSKKQKYYYDHEAVKESAVMGTTGVAASFKRNGSKRGVSICPNSPTPTHREDREDIRYDNSMRNRRSVWTIPHAQYSEAHFATFSPELVKPCILAGSMVGSTILDPFFGSGTVGLVARKLSRYFVGIELNPKYIKMAEKRCELNQLYLYEKE